MIHPVPFSVRNPSLRWKYNKVCALAHTRAERVCRQAIFLCARVRIHSGASFLYNREGISLLYKNEGCCKNQKTQESDFYSILYILFL